MADIKTYTCSGSSKDIALLGSFEPEIIVITPVESIDKKVLLCRNIDYIIQGGSIRFERPLTQGTIVSVPQDVNAQNELINDTVGQAQDNESLSKAVLTNTVTIAESNETFRARFAVDEARIAALEQGSGE